MSRISRIGRLLGVLLLVATFTACGGGGGGGDSTITVGNYTFIPDLTGNPNAANLVSVTLKASETTAGQAVFDLFLTNVEAGLTLSTDVLAVSADLAFDPAWLSFNSVVVDAASAASAAPDAADPTRLVIAVSGPTGTHLGKVVFDVTGTGNTATLAVDTLAYVGPSGTTLADRALNGLGGTLTN